MEWHVAVERENFFTVNLGHLLTMLVMVGSALGVVWKVSAVLERHEQRIVAAELANAEQNARLKSAEDAATRAQLDLINRVTDIKADVAMIRGMMRGQRGDLPSSAEHPG